MISFLKRLPSKYLLFICLLVFDYYSIESMYAQEIKEIKNNWPMYRFDSSRSGVSRETIPEKLNLMWVREYLPPKDAWPEDGALQFASSYHPIAAAGKIFIPSMHHDFVQALNEETGEVIWTCFANGPIRFAPVYDKEKVYFASDDGCLYCVDANTGKEIWQFCGAPRNKYVIGNDRLISAWPVRGGPVLKDRKIYFANGVWPFMGIFVYCLNAENGEVEWVNDGTLENGESRDQRVVNRPYEACPGGYLTIAGDKLFLPAGRMWPSCYDLKSGKRVLYTYKLPISNVPGKIWGSDGGVVANENFWFFSCRNGNRTWSVICDAKKNGELIGWVSGLPASEGSQIFSSRSRELVSYDLSEKTIDKIYKPNEYSAFQGDPPEPLKPKWSTKGFAAHIDPIKIGNCLFFSTWVSTSKRGYGNSLLKAAMIQSDGRAPQVIWETMIDGSMPTIIAANKKLVISTNAGDVMCFGEKETKVTRYTNSNLNIPNDKRIIDSNCESIIQNIKNEDGYILVIGVYSGKLIDALLELTNRRIVIIDDNKTLVNNLRNKMITNGKYGNRIVVLNGDIKNIQLPPYFAESVISESFELPKGEKGVRFIDSILRSLRPYGGKWCFPNIENGHNELATLISKYQDSEFSIKREGNLSVVTRIKLPLGTANWGHSFGGDASNTHSAPDGLLKAPLGVLWFGGEGAEPSLFRNNRGPVCAFDGRVFTFNGKKIVAIDVYTGRIMWDIPSPELAKDKNQISELFTPCVDSKSLYFSNGKKIYEYLPSTGAISREIELDFGWGLGNKGHLLINDNFLIIYNEIGLVCFSRIEGKMLWKYLSKDNKLSMSIISGENLCFAESNSVDSKETSKKYLKSNLISLNLQTGIENWRVPLDWFPNDIIYFEKDQLIISSIGARKFDARSNKDGKLVWSGTPESLGRYGVMGAESTPLWNGKLIIPHGDIVDAATGRIEVIKNPLTGVNAPWKLSFKGWGCSRPSSGGDLLFSRGFDVVFFDMANGGDLSRLDGFRASCTESMIPCSGVVAALNLSNGCTCSNPIFTSLGLINYSELDLWSISRFDQIKQEKVVRAGINFGAPGNRKALDGTLWMEYPIVAIPMQIGEKAPADFSQFQPSGPRLSLEVQPDKIEWFRHHSLRIKGNDLNWVASSGGIGIRSITINLPVGANYTVKLIFAEPDNIKKGERLFAVSIQGKMYIEKLDIIDEAGENLTAINKEFKNIFCKDNLKIEFNPIKGEPVICGVELIIESD